MQKTKMLAILGIYIALLLGAQVVLSGIMGIEIVTVLLLCFCVVFGAKNGVVVAVIFSIIRCFIFGFYPTVIIVYLIYYTLFAMFFGIWGRKGKIKNTKIKLIMTIIIAVIFTVCFSLLDDIVTPLFYGFNKESAYGYFVYSLSAMIPQSICTLVTVSLLYFPLTKVFYRIKLSIYN